MKRTIKLIISIALIVLLVCLLFSCKTMANWTEQRTDSSSKNANIETVNGSEKYIVFAALNGNGDLIAGGAATHAAAYAVVGYTGLVAELVIPATYTDTTIYTAAEGDDHSLPVTKVLVATPYSNYKCSMDGSAYSLDDARLQNNPVVTSIVFGSNVATVGAGVCAGMVNLTKVTFTASSAVTLGHAAFSACNSLTTVTGNWTAATGATPFLASGYTPQ